MTALPNPATVARAFKPRARPVGPVITSEAERTERAALNRETNDRIRVRTEQRMRELGRIEPLPIIAIGEFNPRNYLAT